MVVAQIVNVRNNTLRSFRITPGDYFYTPSVDGQPIQDGPIEVLPGFDQFTQGLTVPWESVSVAGLEISEPNSDDLVRCVVGPVDSDSDDREWLQFRSADGDPVAEERWRILGDRHMLGAIGNSLDISLTFREARNSSTSLASLCELVHFDHAMSSAPRNAVYLNVFDLVSSLSVPNAILCNTVFNTIGAFHAAIEVYGDEWAFYRTPDPTSCGICKSVRPRHHPVHVYRQSVYLGSTSLHHWEVRYLVRGKLATNWRGGTYDLLHQNCIHFCDELALALGVAPVPSWVRGLHETGASLFQLPWPLSVIKSAVWDWPETRAVADVTTDQPARASTADERAETVSNAATSLTDASMAPPPASSRGSGVINEGGNATISSLGTFVGGAGDDGNWCT